MSSSLELSRTAKRKGHVPGTPKTGGRQKGSPNKLTADIKSMIIGALNDAGGQRYLAKRANTHPVAFLALLGRVLPLQVTGQDGQALQVDFRWADATPVEPPLIDATVQPERATITVEHQPLEPES